MGNFFGKVLAGTVIGTMIPGAPVYAVLAVDDSSISDVCAALVGSMLGATCFLLFIFDIMGVI